MCPRVIADRSDVYRTPRAVAAARAAPRPGASRGGGGHAGQPDAAFDITDLGRPPHLAFGGGVHYSLGHLVARADMSEALPVLACRLREPRVSGDAVWQPCSG